MAFFDKSMLGKNLNLYKQFIFMFIYIHLGLFYKEVLSKRE